MKKGQISRKVFALLLALAMVMTYMPALAFAETVAFDANNAKATDVTSLVNAVEYVSTYNGNTYDKKVILENDIVLQSDLKIPVYGNLEFDGANLYCNGHYVHLVAAGEYITLNATANLPNGTYTEKKTYSSDGGFTGKCKEECILCAYANPIEQKVCEIDGKQYDSLAGAFNDAVAGDTINVLSASEENIDLTSLSKSKGLMYFFNPEYRTEENASERARNSGVVFVKDDINTFDSTYSYECELRTYNSEGSAAQKLSATKTIFYGDMETLADLYAKDNKNYATSPKVAGNQCWKTDGLIDLIINNIKDGTRNYSIIMPNRNALNGQNVLIVEKDMILSTYSGTAGRIDFRLMGSEKFTLDLNGHEIYQVSGDNGNGIATTSDGAAALRLSAFSNVTIKDSVGNGSVVGSQSVVDYYGDYTSGDGGILTLESGKLIGRMVPALSNGDNDNDTASYQDGNEKGSIIRMDDTNCTFIMNGGSLDIDRHEYRRINAIRLWKTAAAIQVTQECANATITLNGGRIGNMPEVEQAPTNEETDYPEIIYRDNGASVTKTVSENVVIYPTYVAQIGTTKYTSLAEAVAAVPTDGTETTITMIADEVIAEADESYGVCVSNNQNIILDLNGHKISGKSDIHSTNYKNYALVENHGTLTILGEKTGSEITYEGVADSTFKNFYMDTIINYGIVNVESGKISNTTGTGMICAAIDNNTTLRNATTNIEGGKIEATRVAIRQFANSKTHENNVNISDGEVIGGRNAVMMQGPSSNSPGLAQLTVSGGKIENNSSGKVIQYWEQAYGSQHKTELKVNITKGFFKGSVPFELDPADMSDTDIQNGINVSGGYYTAEVGKNYLASGYECINTPESDPNHVDYPYMIGKADYSVNLISQAGALTSIAPLIGGGEYSPGANVTISAPEVSNYKFQGWYEGETLISQKNTFSFKASRNVTYIAKYEVINPTVKVNTEAGQLDGNTITDVSGKVSITGGGKGISVGATTITAQPSYEDGDTESKKTYKFRYWQNENGQVVGTSTTLNLQVLRDAEVTAIYSPSGDAYVKVLYKTDSEQILQQGSYYIPEEGTGTLDELTNAVAPSRLGYDFVGWTLNGTETATLENIKDKANDEKGETEGKGTVSVTPLYTKTTNTYSVKVETVVGDNVVRTETPVVDFVIGDACKVISPEKYYHNDTEYNFSFFKDEEGNIISKTNEVSLRPSKTGTVTVKAVYGEAVEKTPVVVISDTFSELVGEYNKVGFTMNYTVPAEFEFIKAGFYYADNSSTFGNLETCPVYISKLTTATGTVTLHANVTDKNPKTKYVKAFVTYKDNNEVKTVYTDVISKTYDLN